MLQWRGDERGHGAFSCVLPLRTHLSRRRLSADLRAALRAHGVGFQMFSRMTPIPEQICYKPVQPPAIVG